MTSYFTNEKQTWNLFADWKASDAAQPCEDAKRFIKWRDEVCQKALASSNVILLNQTWLKVAKRYYEFYVSVPEDHKHCRGDDQHICIFSVLMETMQLLREHELSIDPPLLFEPPAPPKKKKKKVLRLAGTSWGEVIAQEE